MKITSLLDLLGVLLILCAVALFVAQWTVPGALGVAGVGVLALSWLIDRRAS